MNTRRRCFAVALLAGVFTGSEEKVDTFRSGPQVGMKIAVPFEVRICNGPDIGDMNCLVCKNEGNPVVMIFAREISGPLTDLVKKINEATARNKDKKMGSFVVFLNEEASTAEKLIELAQKEKIEHTILGLTDSVGPKEYQVAKEADITVVFYTVRTVKANYAFKKGKLAADDVARIVKDLSKILPEK